MSNRRSWQSMALGLALLVVGLGCCVLTVAGWALGALRVLG